MTSPLHYDIRNIEIVKDLITQGFSIYNTAPGIWTMEAPDTISSTKARKLISMSIKFYKVSKDFARTKRKYETLLNQIITSDLSS